MKKLKPSLWCCTSNNGHISFVKGSKQTTCSRAYCDGEIEPYVKVSDVKETYIPMPHPDQDNPKQPEQDTIWICQGCGLSLETKDEKHYRFITDENQNDFERLYCDKNSCLQYVPISSLDATQNERDRYRKALESIITHHQIIGGYEAAEMSATVTMARKALDSQTTEKEKV